MWGIRLIGATQHWCAFVLQLCISIDVRTAGLDELVVANAGELRLPNAASSDPEIISGAFAVYEEASVVGGDFHVAAVIIALVCPE